MHVREMIEREDYPAIFAATLENGWSEQFGHPFHVVWEGSGSGHVWRYHRLFGSYVSERSTRKVRRFLVDSFRFTPVLARWLPQYMMGTLAGTPLGLRLFTRPSFRTKTEVPGSEEMAVVPGNQRVRVFDFSRGRTRVFLKQGFDPRTMKTEIELRADSDPGPFLRIDEYDSEGRWFEEDIFDGYALPRCPPTIRRGKALRRALELLGEWQLSFVREVGAEDYVEQLLNGLRECFLALGAMLREPTRASLEQGIEVLAEEARRSDTVLLTRSHGDLQPGNVLVSRAGDRVVLIDWEHSAWRSSPYDNLTSAIGTRAGGDLGERLRAFLSRRCFPEFGVGEEPWGPALAIFLLEDVLWYARESLTGPFRCASAGLDRYARTFGGCLLSGVLH